MPGWRRGQKPVQGQSGGPKVALAIAFAQIIWKNLQLSDHLRSHHLGLGFSAVLTAFVSEDWAFAIFACMLLLPVWLLAD